MVRWALVSGLLRCLVLEGRIYPLGLLWGLASRDSWNLMQRIYPSCRPLQISRPFLGDVSWGGGYMNFLETETGPFSQQFVYQ
jgi:hypothetical protein